MAKKRKSKSSKSKKGSRGGGFKVAAGKDGNLYSSYGNSND